MLTPVTLPPGVYRNGTVEQSRTRFYDCNLVRWAPTGASGLLTQMLGWTLRDSQQTPLSGIPRACVVWLDNSASRWIAVGTNTNLYIQAADTTVYDITPASFIPGSADAEILTGWGTGTWGVGTWGTERPDSGNIVAAAMWSLDLWNDKLVGVMAEDGRMFEWDLDGGTPAAVIANAPTGVQALVVTAEGFLMALTNRTVQWCTQGDNTVWTASDTNSAGSFPLQTPGTILAASKITGATLIVTTVDAWLAQYQGYPLEYGFTRVGAGCGMVSRGALVTLDQQAAWMGREGFFLYNGFVQPLPCDIADLVFGDLNTDQLTKVTSGHRTAAGEIWWNYCSADSIEIDRQVIWNYRLNVWYPAQLDRSCMADEGVFNTPIMVSPDGLIYAHETGFNYDGAVPFAETGPLRLGNGDKRMEVQLIVPDERNQGDMTLTFISRDYPDSADVTVGPITLTSPTSLLFQAGRIRLHYDFNVAAPATVGDFMLDLIEGDSLT